MPIACLIVGKTSRVGTQNETTVIPHLVPTLSKWRSSYVCIISMYVSAYLAETYGAKYFAGKKQLIQLGLDYWLKASS